MKEYQSKCQQLNNHSVEADIFSKLLEPGELIVHEIRWHWMYYVMPTLTYLLLVGAILMVYRLMFTFKSGLIITNRRIIGRLGIIRPIFINIRNSEIIEFKIVQNHLDRLTNSGYLRLKTVND